MQDMSLDREPTLAGEEEGGAGGTIDLHPQPLEGSVEEEVPDVALPCEFICGCAGSGKTYSCLQRIADDPSWGTLAATTGIAAVNLNTITLNSLIGFFDTDSLRDLYLTGGLARRLHKVSEDSSRLVIDEVSMMDGAQLSLIVRALLEVNAYVDRREHPFGLTLVGDFAQLPPIKAKWAFESDEWHRFATSTTKLTKVWRQGAGPFLDALNLTRAGDGGGAAELLSREGLEWHTALDTSFDGTTIVPKNDQVDRYNGIALDRLPTRAFTLTSRRWGKARSEWKGIPDRLPLKVDTYVMLLSNSYTEDRDLQYANGDCGWIRDWDDSALIVQLARNASHVEVKRVVRDVSGKDKPFEGAWDRGVGYTPRAHRNAKGRYVVGQIDYWPVRLAYASTCHKSQGVSLDRCQIDFRDHFFGNPAMLYVAMSRCRTLGGLRLVGQQERYAKQCKVDPRVREWL